MKRNSRMIIAVLLLAVGSFVAYEAWKDMPGHDAAGAEVAPAAGSASGSAK
jgi:predicted negative regulator of RcsB-dependent stress response